jgi:hypothetical protein
MIIRGLKEHYILVKDSGSRRALFIPRIELHPSDPTNPVKLRRKRFTKRIIFVVEINKPQKQILKYGGMYSPSRKFTTASSMRHFFYPVHWQTSMFQLLKGIENAGKIIASSTSDI